MFAPHQLSQAINPWSWWFGASDNAVGLVNITQYRTNNSEAERRIVHEAAGYGMQLDKIEEVLCILLTCIPKTAFSKEQQCSIDAFHAMMERIRAAKEKEATAQLADGGLESFLANLSALKQSNPALFSQVKEQLQRVLK